MKIAYYSEYLPKSKIGVIIVHGLTEHKGRYEDFIQELMANNMSVFAVDLRGHGESFGKRGDVKKFTDYLTDLNSFVCYIKGKYPELKLTLFGHSLGGLISSGYAATYGGVDLLVLSSPYLSACPKRVRHFRFIPYKLCGFIRLKKTHSESKSISEISISDKLYGKYFTLRLAGVMIRQGLAYAKSRYKDIKMPVLIIGGKLDAVVNSEVFSEALEEFGSKNKTLKIYENKKHRMVQNEDKDKIIYDIINWINQNENSGGLYGKD